MTIVKNGQPAVDSNTGAILVTSVPGTSSGTPSVLNFHATSTASINAEVVKDSACSVTYLTALNTAATARYIRIYDSATAPVPATSVPLATFQIPANSSINLNLQFANSNGLAIDITAAAPDTDATAVAAGDVILSIGYYVA